MYATGQKPPISSFSRLGDTIYVAGHGAVDKAGNYISPDFAEQMRYTMERLKETLEKAGVDFSRVRSVRSYLSNPEDLPLYNEVYREYFGEPFPARTTITGCLPPGLLFEIECVAEAKEEK
jgi:2-iminobutanoate/2-iminopropanoate deaminase